MPGRIKNCDKLTHEQKDQLVQDDLFLRIELTLEEGHELMSKLVNDMEFLKKATENEEHCALYRPHWKEEKPAVQGSEENCESLQKLGKTQLV